MKKNYITTIIGSILMIMGLALVVMIVSHWNATVDGVEAFPVVFGGSILFFVVGLVLFISNMIENKKKSRFIEAKENCARSEELFALEDDVKTFYKKESIAFVIIALGSLLAGFVWLISYLIEHEKGVGIIVVVCIIIAFLSFAGIGIVVGSIKQLMDENRSGAPRVNGELKKVVLTNKIKTNNNIATFDEYRLLIKYTYENKECEILTEESYSKDQVKHIRKLEYIPLVIRGGFVEVDKQRLLNSPQHIDVQSDIEVEKDVYSKMGNAKVGEENADKNLVTLNTSLENVDTRIRRDRLYSVVVAVPVIAFLVVFVGLAITGAIYSGSILIAMPFILFSLFIFWKAIISPICENSIYKKTMNLGEESYTENYKFISQSSENSQRRRILIQIEYSDQFNKLRKKTHNLYVSPFYLESNGIKKIPIKVWKKNAIIDYDRLLKR